MGKGESIGHISKRIDTPVNDLRLTLIDVDGNVIFDNNDKTPFPESNHNDRPEVIAARKQGAGYAVVRMSESDDIEYFYSATLLDDGSVLRSAALYDHTLKDFLKADRSFLWIMFLVTIAVSFAGYYITRRISTSISNLNIFSEKAGKGERIYDNWSFPHDELGNIAGNIVRLYVEREERSRDAIKQEREKIRLKKQLTNNINHELKTPVASIKLCSDLLLDHPEMEYKRKEEFIRMISREIGRLSDMLEDVASITRMDDGAEMIEKETIDLKNLIENVVETERIKTDMEIRCILPEMVIHGNRRLLESIFRNLIDNAIAYSGGSEICISSDDDGNFIVRDNGCGVPEEHIDHLFERFYRIDKGRSRKKGGTGLGLSIVKNAVSLHGGEIHVSNDGGLRFDFRMKLNKNVT